MKTELRFLSVLFSLLTLPACQSLHPDGASRAEKSAALSAHLADWKQPQLVNQFARPRTTQVFNNLVLDASQRRIEASSTGQATFLTRDGYALTAAHVLDDGPLSVLRLKSPRPGQLSLTSAGPVFFPAGRNDRSTRVRIPELEALPVRTVLRFRGTDLALVKLPLTPTRTFTMAGAMPARDTTIFAYGSNLSGNSSGGKVLDTHRQRSVRTSATIWRLTTTIPLQKGDSGGPVMDADGQLVGIISRGQTRLLDREINSTIALSISPEHLRRLIDQDRREN